jgi:hypothetical protein
MVDPKRIIGKNGEMVVALPPPKKVVTIGL